MRVHGEGDVRVLVTQHLRHDGRTEPRLDQSAGSRVTERMEAHALQARQFGRCLKAPPGDVAMPQRVP
jgi:hypothetical protein